MADPSATPLRMWNRVIESTIAWDDVRARLEREEAYWLVSVPPRGTPAPRPVWGVWLDERLLLSVGSTSHWAGIQSHPEVAVHLGDPLDVVIVEGRARKAIGDELLRRYVDVYNAKYSWNFDAASPMVADGTIEVMPSAVLAWTTVPVAECTTDMTFPTTAGRWRFA